VHFRVETRRENGKVRHEHVASLGSIETPLSVAARMEFWRGLHERLAQLSNRLDAEMRGKVVGAMHTRVLRSRRTSDGPKLNGLLNPAFTETLLLALHD
jgi:hypothetical protein